MYAIEQAGSIVRLIPFDPRVVGTALCSVHAERLAPPVGWRLRDDRPGVPTASTEPGGIEDEPTGTGDLDGLLKARTPLLARAFRSVSPEGDSASAKGEDGRGPSPAP